MKRFFALLMLVLFACAPVAAFAAEQPSAGGRTGQSDQAGQADGGEEEEGRGDTFDTGEEAASPLDTFAIGMDRKDAREAGAEPTTDPDTMLLSLSWNDVEWKTILIFKDDKLASMVMRTDLDNRAVIDVFAAMKDRDCKVLSSTGVKEKEIEYYKLKAQGKGDDALEAAFDKALEAFIDAGGGKFVSVFCPGDTLDMMADVVKNKGDEDAALEKEGDTVIFLVQLDKNEDTMLVMMTTFATINAQ